MSYITVTETNAQCYSVQYVVYCTADSELCHKFTQSLTDKKQVVIVSLLVISPTMLTIPGSNFY